MEKFIIILAVQILLAVFWYSSGYSEREKKFQNRPIDFNYDGKTVLWVGRETGIIKVRIFDEKVVEVIKDPLVVK